MSKKESMIFHRTIGVVMKELMKSVNWNTDKLARTLTIQLYKNLPKSDIVDFPLIDDLSQYKISLTNSNEKNNIINDYIDNKHNKANYIFVNSEGEERSLNHAISKNSMTDYLNGRTPVPILVLLSFCQIFNISIDNLISQAYRKLGLNSLLLTPNELTLEQAYSSFFKKVFSETKDDRYVFDAAKQGALFTSLLLDGKNELSFHFTYLPRKLGLRAVKDQREVIYQRGVLTFTLKDSMCHVTSKIEVSSQGIPTEYRGFAIITNPNSVGPACTCFLKEINNAFGIFIIFSFRLSSLENTRKQKTRISECIAVRKDDGTSYVYRLLLSKNYIDDEKMKYFVGYLKMGTSENTIDKQELSILFKEKYLTIAKKYFNNLPSDGSKIEDAIYADLQEHFGEENKSLFFDIVQNLDQLSINKVDSIRIINPTMLSKVNRNYLLFLGWLGKYGLSARTDKIEKEVDIYVESIHKEVYPELHKDSDEKEFLCY